MWDEVKQITLLLEQNNSDGSRFVLYFYSTDYELIKLREATHFDDSGNLIGSYSRLTDAHLSSNLSLNFFIEKLTKTTIQKMIEYYENPKLFVEYMC